MKSGKMTGLWFLLPYLLFFVVFLASPTLFAFYMAFHSWDLVTPPEWIGLRNILFLLDDDRFHQAVANTLWFIALHIPLQMLVALGLALALDQKIMFRALFRAIYFLPVVISGSAITILWLQLYQTDGGLLNDVLQRMMGIKIPWLTHPGWAMPSIALMATWKNVGFYVVLYLARLQGVPASLYEAASLDGATPFQQFRYITMPQLQGVTLLIGTLSTITGFQLFIEPYVLTGGGPMGSTMSMVLYMYKHAFTYQHMGYAATLGLALGCIIMLVILVQRRIMGEGEER